jgi:hypothetical protein
MISCTVTLRAHACAHLLFWSGTLPTSDSALCSPEAHACLRFVFRNGRRVMPFRSVCFRSSPKYGGCVGIHNDVISTVAVCFEFRPTPPSMRIEVMILERSKHYPNFMHFRNETRTW